MSRRLKIFFHDNCFDGAASAAVFADFYRARFGPGVDVALQGVQHRVGDPFEGLALDGDDNACVDFRYCDAERMTWWFDHHVSAFQPGAKRAHFEADTTGQKFYDPTARSNTLFQAGVLTAQFGYEPSETFTQLVHWADIIDGAQFASARQAVELAEPALQLMTWLEHNPDEALTHRYIELLGHASLEDILTQSWVADPLRALMASHQSNIELVREAAVAFGPVVFTDLIERAINTPNKFIAYYLHPECSYALSLSRVPERVKISLGFNPWSQIERRYDIAAICERYGGGGHPFVGAVSLAPDQLDRAREICAEIRHELGG